MLQEDDEAVELKHAEDVGFGIVPAVDQAAEVVQTSEEPLDLPAAIGRSSRRSWVLLRRLLSRIRYFA